MVQFICILIQLNTFCFYFFICDDVKLWCVQQETGKRWNGTSSTGEKEKDRMTGVWRASCRQKPALLDAWHSLKTELYPTQWSACQVSWCWNREMIPSNLICHTETDSRNHFYNQWHSNNVSVSGGAQIFTACLILWFDDEPWI